MGAWYGTPNRIGMLKPAGNTRGTDLGYCRLSDHPKEVNMRSKIKSPEDFWSGLMFIGFGILAIVVSRDYPMGQASRMGPGYFPTHIGFMLVVFGAIITATAFKFEGEGITPFAYRPMILLSVAFAFFGGAIDHFGFVPALLGLILLCSAAGREFKWLEVLVMCTLLAVGSWALFIWALKLPMTLICWR